jgi:rhamnulose-1-phosphate aldolase
LSDYLHHLPELREIQQVHDWLTQWRWAEAAGGNFSIRLQALPDTASDLSGKTPKSLPLKVPSLAGAYLLLSARGARARDIAVNPETGTGLYWILQNGSEFTCLWGNQNPTSELHMHLSVHAALIQFRSKHTAILHSHPSNLIALTHVPEFEAQVDLSDILLRLQSEARIHLPEGIGHLPYHLPGSKELGRASADSLVKTPVLLWHLHGAVATGQSISEALDYLEIVDKAAQIYWILRSSGIQPEGIMDADLERSLRHFKVWERYRRSLD